MTRDQDHILTELHREQYDRMYRSAYRQIGTAEFADDLVQQVFLVACGKPEDVCDHEVPDAWLMKTLNFLILRERERFYHSREVSEPDMSEFIGEEDVELSLEALLPDALSKVDREIILLKYRDHLSHEQIASKYCISVMASKKRLSRAVERYRKLLEENDK